MRIKIVGFAWAVDAFAVNNDDAFGEGEVQRVQLRGIGGLFARSNQWAARWAFTAREPSTWDVTIEDRGIKLRARYRPERSMHGRNHDSR